VFDSGVIDRAATNAEFRWVLHELLESGWLTVIPTMVLSEAITGRPDDAPANQVIRRLDTVDTSQATARRAGLLRFSVQRTGVRRYPVASMQLWQRTPLIPAQPWSSPPIQPTCGDSSLTIPGSPLKGHDLLSKAPMDKDQFARTGAPVRSSTTTSHGSPRPPS
jgi:hypothetical protein